MSRRGNPYDNAKAESFMKTLKAEAVCLAAYETFEDITADLPRFIEGPTTSNGCTPRSAISAPFSSRSNGPGRRSNPKLDSVHPKGRTPSRDEQGSRSGARPAVNPAAASRPLKELK